MGEDLPITSFGLSLVSVLNLATNKQFYTFQMSIMIAPHDGSNKISEAQIG